MCIRPKGRTQCIFPRSQHTCLYIHVYILKVNLYQVVVGQQSVRTNHSLNFFCKCFFLKWPLVAILDVQKSLLAISDQYHNFFCVNFFTKWLPMAILDVQNSLLMTFLAISDQYISGHFRSMRIFYFFFTKWLPAAILDVRKSLSITFLSFQINIIYTNLSFIFNFLQNGHRRPFWIPKFTFDRISGHFRSIHNFNFFRNFDKMAAVGHFRCPKFTFDRISGHFRSTRIFFDIMAVVGHFGCPKFTFHRISGHFRSIRIFFGHNGCCRPFWMSEIHFRSHFWTF